MMRLFCLGIIMLGSNLTGTEAGVVEGVDQSDFFGLKIN